MLSQTQSWLAHAALVATVGATVPSSAYAEVGRTDDVLITANGFDLGGDGFEDGKPTQPAALAWNQTSILGVRPRLSGDIHFDGVASSCARVRIRSYNEDNEEIGDPAFSDEYCVHGDGHVKHAIEVSGAFGAVRVEIRLQTEAGGEWSAVGKEVELEYGTSLPSDELKMAKDPNHEFMFGRGELVDGKPSDSALVQWLIVNGDETWPILSGILFVSNGDDLCGIVRAEYLSDGDRVLYTEDSPMQCLTDDALHTFSITMGGYHGWVQKVRYSIHSKPRGSLTWEQRDSVTVSVGES